MPEIWAKDQFLAKSIGNVIVKTMASAFAINIILSCATRNTPKVREHSETFDTTMTQ
jgi:hypothetical protein